MYQQRQLEKLGYAFVPGKSGLPSDLVLRQKADTKKGFLWKGQDNYDEVGDAVVACIQGMLTSDLCGLESLPLPPAAGRSDASSVVYATPGFQTKRGPLLLLVCGMPPGGAAGVWGRKLCMNDSLHEGAMFDYIARGHAEGWSVVVANPNESEVAGKLIEGSECPHQHLRTLWRSYIEPSEATCVLVVAHSYGACSTAHLLKSELTALERIQAVAFTDASVVPPGTLQQEKMNPQFKSMPFMRNVAEFAPKSFDPALPAVRARLAGVCRDFVACPAKPGTPVAADRRGDGVVAVSAGHVDHPSTTHAAADEVFRFLRAGLDGTAAAGNEKIRQACASMR